MNPSSKVRDIIASKHILKKNIIEYFEPEKDLEIAGNTFECLNLPQPLPIPIQNKKIKELEDKSYDYNLDFLNKGRPKKIKKVNLCIYSVITSGYYPFIQYLLYNYKQRFYWPFINVRGDLKMKPEEKLQSLGLENVSYYEGYFEDGDECYMFYKLVDNLPNLELLYSKDTFWFALIEEICRSRMIVDIEIDKSVYKIFERNPCLGFIRNKEGIIFENPIGLYKGVSSNRLEWIASFGVIKGSIYATMGPYYYFSDFQTAGRFGSWTVNFRPAIKEGITDNKFGRYTKGGVVRFAIFLGKLNVLLARDDDDITPNAVTEKQKKLFKERNFDMVPDDALKFTDNLGEWVKKYDSIYLGDIDLNTESYQKYLFIGASYTVKNYFQQYPLSYHYLDKKTVGPMYNKKSVFKIE